MNRIYRVLGKGVVSCLLFLASSNSIAQQGSTQESNSNAIAKVQQFYQQGQWDKGKALVVEELKDNTYDADLRMLLGKYYFHHKQYDKARYELVKAIQYSPKHVEAKQMLVNVEMETKRYSSAICYINELLEINPYWKGLWGKKIVLYELQGNNEEAQRLRARLHQIYPEDTLLKKDYQYTTELAAIEEYKRGNIDKSIELRQVLLQSQPQSEAYYLDLINELLKGGDRVTALNYTDRALLLFPNQEQFIHKKAGILAEEKRYSELLPFLRSQPSQKYYSYYVLEAAQNARKNQPEVLYGEVFEQQPANEEAFSVVFSTALAKQQYEDALVYLERHRKAKGPSKALSVHEYKIHKALGNTGRTTALLQQLFADYGSDDEIREAYVQRYVDLAKGSMADERYQEAVYAWNQVRLHGDEQAYITAQRGLYTAQEKLGRMDLASATLQELLVNYPTDRDLLFKKVDLAFKQQQYKQAIATYAEVLVQVTPQERAYYLIGYEELQTKIIQKLRESNQLSEAMAFVQSWLAEDPSNYNALVYATNLAIQLRNPELHYAYAVQGSQHYGQDAFFKAKMIAYLAGQKDANYDGLFEEVLVDLKQQPYHEELRNVFVEVSEKHTTQLLKEQQFDEALVVVNTALDYVPDDKTLKYTKGRVFEKQKLMDSAFYYQSFYVPGPMELQAHKQHLNYLKYAGGSQQIGLTYLRARHGDVDEISAVSSIDYTKMAGRNTYVGRVNYVGRPSGKGVQLQGEWNRTWNPKTTTHLDIAWANDHFPSLVVNGAVSRLFETLGNTEFTLGLGYRKLDAEAPKTKKEAMFNLLIGASKAWDKFSLQGKFNNFSLDSEWLYNVAVDGRYYLSSPKNYVMAMASVGSAPDVELIDYQLYSGFSVLNTMVGVGAAHLITSTVQVGVTGAWYNYKSSKDIYRDLYTIYFHLNVAF